MTSLQLEILQQIYPGKAAVRLASLASAIDLAPQTLRNWSAAGTCPFPTQKIGGARVARLQDVAAWLDRLDAEAGGMATLPAEADPAAQPASPRRRGRPTKVESVERSGGEK